MVIEIMKRQEKGELRSEIRNDLSELRKQTESYEKGKVKDITEEKYNDLCLREKLTDKEVQQVVKFSNKNDIILDLGLTKITDNQAQILSEAFRLKLNGLTGLTTQQTEILSKKEGALYLDGLKGITDVQALLLSGIERLHLNGVEYLTDKQVLLLLGGNVEILELKGLKRITDAQAGLLSKSRNPLLKLSINDSILTPRQRQILGDENKNTITIE